MGRVYEFIANSGDGVFAVDRRQSIVLWNEKASSILGFSAEETLGKKCYSIVKGRDAANCAACRRGCAAITAAEQLEALPTSDIAVRTKGGAETWLNLSTVVVPARTGELSTLVHLFREVTREHDLLRIAREFAHVVSEHTPGPDSSRSPSHSSHSIAVELTRRERQILALLTSGVSTCSIAEELRISPRTVRNHVNNILVKLDVHSRLEAVTYSIRNGLV